jgi:hypothetical protein
METSSALPNASCNIVWLDANACDDEEAQGARAALENISDACYVFTSTDDCRCHIQSTTQSITILVVSGRLSREITPLVENLRTVLGIFIYCMDKTPHIEWMKLQPKVIFTISFIVEMHLSMFFCL